MKSTRRSNMGGVWPRKRWAKRIGLCTLFAGTIVGYLAWSHGRLTREISQEKARLAALGVSLSIQPRSKDSTSPFLRYGSAIGSLNSSRRSGYGPGTLEAHLKAMQPILEEIRRLSTDRTAPASGNWENVHPHRTMFALIDMARVLRREGKPSEAASWLQTALAFSREWDQESKGPAFSRMDGRLYAEAGALLRAFHDNPECQKVVSDIADYPLMDKEAASASCYDVYRSLDADLAKGLLYDDPCMPATDRQLAAIRVYNLGTTRLQLHLRALRCLRLQSQVLKDEDRPYSELMAAEEQALSTFWSGPMSDVGAFASCLFEEFPISIAQPRILQKTRARLLQAALVLYKATKGGRLPAILPSGPVFTDPYTLRPFILHEVPGGFRLYSAGRNGVDDGGFDLSSDDIEFARDYQTESR